MAGADVRCRPLSHTQTFMFKRCLGLLAALALLTGTGCRGEQPLDDQQQHIKEVVAAGGVVDSILPIAVHLERFRKNLGPSPDSLAHGSASMEALVERWVAAVEKSDTAALNRMVMNRAEFAWFYYPESKMSKPPYEAPPELFWGQLLGSSDEGARGVLKALGGKSVKLKKLTCPNAPTVEGLNRLHEGCELTLQVAGKTLAEGVYFGTILERDHRFKFVGYSNRL